jgi:hypothetical protein
MQPQASLWSFFDTRIGRRARHNSRRNAATCYSTMASVLQPYPFSGRQSLCTSIDIQSKT